MSNRKRARRPGPNAADQAIAALDGAEIPGGCDHCNAIQRVQAFGAGSGVHRITILHDDWCPWYAQATAED